ncbi:MAG: radical SAM protein [Deltaproteobacteria bacterium]|jgi:nitrogen fixation protein NifB|nr:radical SAM protein [Deltaproteobacteria bacterium]
MNVPGDHPCFSADCRPNLGRIHLPVAPGCNIFCRFCSRGISGHLDRPGQAFRAITPREALGALESALRLCPEIRVAGVAGPGDPLAGPEALETLALVRAHHPSIIGCLSTNGLALYESMEGLLLAGVRTVTVTVNAVDPRILSALNGGVILDGRTVAGTDGAEILIAAQERGMRLASQNSLAIKANMVLVPGLNDGHVAEVARRVRDWGANLMNVIPLIPAGGLAGIPAPSAMDVERAAREAGRFLPVKRNCRRCRADACGVPGLSDFSREIYGPGWPRETFSHG